MLGNAVLIGLAVIVLMAVGAFAVHYIHTHGGVARVQSAAERVVTIPSGDLDRLHAANAQLADQVKSLDQKVSTAVGQTVSNAANKAGIGM